MFASVVLALSTPNIRDMHQPSKRLNQQMDKNDDVIMCNNYIGDHVTDGFILPKLLSETTQLMFPKRIESARKRKSSTERGRWANQTVAEMDRCCMETFAYTYVWDGIVNNCIANSIITPCVYHMVYLMMKIMSRSPRIPPGTVLYRGSSIPFDQYNKNMRFMSFTTNISVAETFARPGYVGSYTVKETDYLHGLWFNKKHGTSNFNEEEILIGPGVYIDSIGYYDPDISFDSATISDTDSATDSFEIDSDTPVSNTPDTSVSKTSKTSVSKTANTPVSKTSNTPVSKTANTPVSKTANAIVNDNEDNEDEIVEIEGDYEFTQDGSVVYPLELKQQDIGTYFMDNYNPEADEHFRRVVEAGCVLFNINRAKRCLLDSFHRSVFKDWSKTKCCSELEDLDSPTCGHMYVSIVTNKNMTIGLSDGVRSNPDSAALLTNGKVYVYKVLNNNEVTYCTLSGLLWLAFKGNNIVILPLGQITAGTKVVDKRSM